MTVAEYKKEITKLIDLCEVIQELCIERNIDLEVSGTVNEAGELGLFFRVEDEQDG